MRLLLTASLVLLVSAGFSASSLTAQTNSAVPPVSASTIALHATSTMNVASEMGGAFMNPVKCDGDGNLYIRKLATDRPMLGPVVKIDREGKRTALFDPAVYSQLGLDRADAFSPASDGGLYRIAQSGVLKPRIYVLHFSSDGSPSSPTRLDADMEVYTFAAFAEGNFLVSGVKRDLLNRNDRGRNFTAVFSADGRELAQLSFRRPQATAKASEAAARSKEAQTAVAKNAAEDAEKRVPMLDLADAEVGRDGNLYVMHGSSPALVYVIAPSGKVIRTIKVAAPLPGATPAAFHLSENQLAILFGDEKTERRTVVVADAETGRKIASYADAPELGPAFACFSANERVFTFLNLGEGNTLDVTRAEP
jgi:hypothetical protein